MPTDDPILKNNPNVNAAIMNIVNKNEDPRRSAELERVVGNIAKAEVNELPPEEANPEPAVEPTAKAENETPEPEQETKEE